MNDETRRVLDLLAQGKITVDEADQLLRAVGTSPRAESAAPSPAAPAGDAKAAPRYMRINIHKAANEWRGDKDVNIRVPIAIVRSGIRLGAIIPGFMGGPMAAHLREQGVDVDLSKLDPAMIESVLENLGELNIDVDSGKAQVRITCE